VVLDIDTSLNAQTAAMLESAYAENMFLYDASDYLDPSADNYIGVLMKKIVSYDANNHRFNLAEIAANKIPSDYIEKNCVVCFGGAVMVKNCNTQNNFGIIDTRLGGAGINWSSTYGHYVGSMYSQGDAIPIVVTNYSLGNYYGSLTAEGPKSGAVVVSYYYDYSVLVARSTGYNDNYKSKDMRSIANSSKASTNLVHAKSILRRKIPKYYTSGETLEINEQSPDLTIINNKNGFKIQLIDTMQNADSYNPFGIKTVYVIRSNQSGNFTVSLSDDLSSLGYGLHGGTNGALTFALPAQYLKIMVGLVNKNFFVFTEELTEPTAIQA
jgi:hypothetical protein